LEFRREAVASSATTSSRTEVASASASGDTADRRWPGLSLLVVLDLTVGCG
jgi:hypothetical protein